MFQFLTSRLMHKSPIVTQGLVDLTVLISTCALVFFSAPAMISQALACLLVPAHLSKLPSQPSKFIAKCLEILTATSRMRTQWMQEQQAWSLEIDKTLADIRADLVALQSVPISSAETKSPISDWTLPVSAGSAGSTSYRRPSQTLNPG